MADTTKAAANATITRAMKANATSTIAAINRNHVRVLKPRDPAFGGNAFEACRTTPSAAPDLATVFARFRFLAKAIGGAEIEHVECRDSQMSRGLYKFGSGAPTASAIRRAWCSRLPS